MKGELKCVLMMPGVQSAVHTNLFLDSTSEYFVPFILNNANNFM